MQRLLVCGVILFSANLAEAKDRGPAPAGGDALRRWCFNTVVVKYGQNVPVPGNPHRIIMLTSQAVAVTDMCVQSHGKFY
jgi:hypothetical protein